MLLLLNAFNPNQVAGLMPGTPSGGGGQVARPAPKPPAPAYVTDLNHPQLERDDDAQAHAVIDVDDWLVLL